MVRRTFILSVATCTLLTIGPPVGAQTPNPVPRPGQPAAPSAQPTPQVTVPFSDPSRPGTVTVSVLNGSISVKAGSGRDVVVTTTGARDDERERVRERNRARDQRDDPAAGLRRLSQPAGVNIEEENNVVSISSPAMAGHVNIAIEAPAATRLVLRAVNGGEVSVEGITGSIEVNNVNGSIRLADVAGPVIAHATNGRVVATLRQIAVGKPMSFTSFNGNVDVTLPAAAKAGLKMRSDRGDVYTDFDVQATQAPARVAQPRSNSRTDRDSDDPKTKDRAKYRLEMDRSIYGTINGGGPDFELRTFNGNIYLRKAN